MKSAGIIAAGWGERLGQKIPKALTQVAGKALIDYTLDGFEAAGIQRKRGSQGRVAGWRLAGSYVNFYLANGGLVMPLLDPATDKVAARRLKRLFPDRKVVGVPAREILLGGGNIHCITQQVPRRGNVISVDAATA